VNRIAQLLLRSFLAPFAVTLPVALFILDMQFLWVYADDLIGKGLSPLVIGELMIFASARLVNLALPLAILVASIMGMGALAERNELTAMKVAGLSLFRIFRPLIAVMLLLSVGAFTFSNNVWPVANLKFRALLFSVTKKKPGLNLLPGEFYNGIEGFSIRVADRDPDGTLHDVLIHDHREATTGSSRIIRAATGRMDVADDGLIMELLDGVTYEEDMEAEARRREKVQPHISGSFDRQMLRIDLASLDFNKVDEGLFKRVHEMMNIRQLDAAMDSLEGVAAKRRQDIVDYGMRMTGTGTGGELRSLTGTGADGRGEIREAGGGMEWIAGLTASERRAVFDAARGMSRNAVQGIENALDDAEKKRRLRNRNAVEWHRKFFLGTSCILLFFIGAPLGAIIRKGGLGLPTVFAIFVFLVYYILSIVGEQMVRSDTIDPVVGMWMSTAVLTPVAVLFTRMAMREVHVLRMPSLKFWKKS
jgi:lipopolysaccharide export system permease protein